MTIEGTSQLPEERLWAVLSGAPVMLLSLDAEGTVVEAEGKGLEALGIAAQRLVGRNLLQVLRRDSPGRREIERALAGEEVTTEIELYGRIFETQFLPRRIEDRSIGVLGYAVDVTEQRRPGSDRERLGAFARSLVSQGSLEDLLWMIAEGIGDLFGYPECVVYLYDDAKGVLEPRAAHGPRLGSGRRMLNRGARRKGDGAVGVAANTLRPEWAIEEVPSVKAKDGALIPRVELAVPIVDPAGLLGVIAVESTGASSLGVRDVELIRTCADMVSTPIRHAELLEGLERRVADRTRELEELNEQLELDIRLLRLAEDELKTAESQYRELFERASDAILVFEPETERILDANSRAADLYGLPRRALVGKSLREFTVDTDRGRREIEHTLEVGTTDGFETRQRRADGTILALWITAARIEFRGRPAILSINRDFTSLKAAHAELERSEQRYRDLFESIDMAIVIFDAERKVVDCNRRAREYFPELVSAPGDRPIGGLFVEGSRERLDQEIERVRQATAGEESFELESKPSGGAARLFGAALNVATLDPGQPRLFQLRLRDITDAVADRRRLKEAETMAAYGRMVAGVAHEVRNPLFGIEAATWDLARNLPDDETAKRKLDLIQRETARVKRLMDELLDYARPKPMIRAAVDVGDLLREVLELDRLERPAQLPELILDAIETMPMVEMDRGRMLQVLMNLVTNASRHAAGATEIRLGAGVSTTPGAPPMMYLKVADNGCGIPPEHRPLIFEPFFTSGRKGTGLGLAIVKRIVSDHGGTIDVVTETSVGSIFVVNLPVGGAGAAA